MNVVLTDGLSAGGRDLLKKQKQASRQVLKKKKKANKITFSLRKWIKKKKKGNRKQTLKEQMFLTDTQAFLEKIQTTGTLK